MSSKAQKPTEHQTPGDHSEATSSRMSGGTTYDSETGEVLSDLSPGFDQADVEIVEIEQREFIAMGQLVPSVDWINQHVVAKGKGTRVALARLIGIASKAQVQKNQHQGKELDSIRIDGHFKLTMLETGQMMQAPTAFLPKAWSKQVFALLDGADPSTRVKMILALGVEATGKTIPYRWTVSMFRPAHDEVGPLAELETIAERIPSPRKPRLVTHQTSAA